MARTVYNVSLVNIPRTIAGIEWKLVASACMFFGLAALMFRAPAVLVAPAGIVLFLRGPGMRDHEFLNIYRKHSRQRNFYSPAYQTAVNYKLARPSGFSRFKNV